MIVALECHVVRLMMLWLFCMCVLRVCEKGGRKKLPKFCLKVKSRLTACCALASVAETRFLWDSYFFGERDQSSNSYFSYH